MAKRRYADVGDDGNFMDWLSEFLESSSPAVIEAFDLAEQQFRKPNGELRDATKKRKKP